MLEWFHELMMSSYSEITFQEIQAWSEITYTPINHWQAIVLKRMVFAYASKLIESSNEDCPAPYLDGHDLNQDDRDSIAEKIKRQLRRFK